MTEEGLFEPLKEFGAKGGAVYGTCAGAILLAREVHHPSQASLGLLDASVLVMPRRLAKMFQIQMPLGPTIPMIPKQTRHDS